MLILRIDNIFVDIIGEFPESLWPQLERELSFRPQTFQFQSSYNRWIRDKDGNIARRAWDGWKRQIWRGKKRTYFPTGLYSIVRDFFKKHNIEYKIQDTRQKPIQSSDIVIAEEIQIRDYQQQIINTACNTTRGIIQVATGGGKCINKNSLCFTEHGMIKISDFYTKKFEPTTICNENGHDIATQIYHDGESLSISITTSYNFSLCGTPVHRIKVIDSNGYIIWKKLEDINDNDYCVILKNQNMFGKGFNLDWNYTDHKLCNDYTYHYKNNLHQIDEDTAYFIGIIIGDGCLTQRNIIRITNENEHIIKFIQKYCDNNSLKLFIKKHKTSKTCKELMINSVSYRNFLIYLGMPISDTCGKKCPIAIMMSPKKIVAAFIRGLFETDGYVTDHRIGITLCAKDVINDLQIILLNFGIISSVRKKQTKRRTAYVLTIYRNYLEIFIKEIGFDPNGKKYNKLNKLIDTLNRKKINSNKDIIPNQNKKLFYIYQELLNKYTINEIFHNISTKHKTVKSWFKNRFPNRQSLTIFLDEIEYFILQLNNQSITQIYNSIKHICSNNLYYDKVKTIKQCHSDNYDFVVPNSQSFFSQGFVNHNTVIACGIMAELKALPFVFFVTSIDLLTQAKEEFEKFLRSQNLPISVGQIGGGIIDIKDINVMTVQTAIRALGYQWNEYKYDEDDNDDKTPIEERKDDIIDLLSSAKGAISDECQHWKANTCQTISRSLKSAYYTFGLSATPYRDEGDDLLIQACFGKKIAEINASKLIKLGWLIKPDIKMVHIRQPKSLFKTWQSIYKEQVVENIHYNGIVANIANAYINNNRLVLVLIRQISHGKLLESMIPNSVFLSGSSPKKNRENGINKLRRKEISCIISSVIFDEGIDIKPLDTVILAGHGKSKTRALQRIGRILRPFENKTKATAIDFCLHQKYLEKHSIEREKMYRTEEEFSVEDIDPKFL